MKYNGTIEVCEYCGACYHPMPRWVKGGDVIFVHNYRFNFTATKDEPFAIPDDTCEKIARENGYEIRLDLTPKR